MRIFVADATGAIGRQLLPRLAAAGHEVYGMTRNRSKQEMLRELGAVPAVADALDPDQVGEAVATAAPDVVVHQLTAIGSLDMRLRGRGRGAGVVASEHEALQAGEQIASPRAFIGTVTTPSDRHGFGASAPLASGSRSPSSPTDTETRPRTPRWPSNCQWRCWCSWRACHPSSGLCCCFTMSSSARTRRSQRSWASGWTTCASWPPVPGATSNNGGRASARRRSSGTNWLAGSSMPPNEAIWPAWKALLAEDVTLTGDGGGKVPAIARPLRGCGLVRASTQVLQRGKCRAGSFDDSIACA